MRPTEIGDNGRMPEPRMVSGLYRLAKPEPFSPTAGQVEERLKSIIQRLVTEQGQEMVLSRLREYIAAHPEETERGHWAMLTAWGSRNRQPAPDRAK